MTSGAGTPATTPPHGSAPSRVVLPRRALFAPLVILALAAALLLVRLGEPDWTPARPQPGLPMRYVWDESVYAFSAHRYLRGDPDAWKLDSTLRDLRAFDATDLGPFASFKSYHPPLAPFVMTASSAALGWSAFAVRLPGALCGVVLVACAWLLGRRVRGAGVAALAAALVATDGVWFTISRVAIPHVYVAAATAAALVTGLAAWEDDARRARMTLATGALCGLGVAFKETAAIPALVLGAALLARTWRRASAQERARALGTWAVAFLLLPPAIYVASWLPYFVGWDKSWSDFVAIHREFAAWHAAQPAAMGPSTPWWTWPAVWKPVRLFEEGLGRDAIRRIVAEGNPVLWWTAILAIPWTLVRFVRGGAARDLWVAGGYLATWLPYAAVPRFGFSYYLLPAAPCAAVAVACALDDAAGARPRLRRSVFAALALGAAAWFAWRYPALAAVPVTRS